MRRILNITRAVVRLPIFLWAWIRSKPATYEVASKRLKICGECEELDLLTRQCTKCWCFVRLKVTWEAEHCKLHKW